MKNQHVLHDLLFLNEHLLSTQYVTDRGISIMYCELERGKHFGFEQTPNNQLLIFMGGSCTVNYTNFTDRKFIAGQMVFINRLSFYVGQVIEDMKLLIMSFEAPVGKYDKQILTYQTRCHDMKYDFQPTFIRYPLTEFFNLLTYCLKEGVSSSYWYELKHQELFLYLRTFYTEEETSCLFHEVMGQSLQLREFVYEHYTKVSTLNELIELSNMSRSVFFRKFKKEFNETAYQWMLKQKCQQILSYLEQPETTIKEVINRFKFSSFSNFNRFCKNNYGCSPKRLIENIHLKNASQISFK